MLIISMIAWRVSKKLQKLEEKVFFRSFLTKSLKSFIDVMKMWAVKYKR